MATSYFCGGCNYETEERTCPHCLEPTETLKVKDDPLLGAPLGDEGYTLTREEEQYL